MMMPKKTMRVWGVAMVLTLGLASATPGLRAVAAAQDRLPAQRVVHGHVLDKNGTPVKGAVVYLRDTRSTAVKTAIAADDGSYRFVQLSGNTDYELWAKQNDAKSKTRAISSFDNKNDFEISLTL